MVRGRFFPDTRKDLSLSMILELNALKNILDNIQIECLKTINNSVTNADFMTWIQIFLDGLTI